MTIDPDTLRKGDMLLSPDGALYNVTDAMKIVMNFAFADKATEDAAIAEGWNPVEDKPRASYVFGLLSLDGQERTSLTAMGGEPVPDGWEVIAKAPEPEETDDEPSPTVTYRR
jgi:hypothetical protein